MHSGTYNFGYKFKTVKLLKNLIMLIECDIMIQNNLRHQNLPRVQLMSVKMDHFITSFEHLALFVSIKMEPGEGSA